MESFEFCHRCPKCAQPKFKRKGGRALEEESVAEAEGEEKKAKAKIGLLLNSGLVQHARF